MSYVYREELDVSLRSLREESERREREWEDERERRDVSEQSLKQCVKELQASLSKTEKEKTEARY